MSVCIDHLTVVAPTLDAGSAFVRDALGVLPAPGRKHPNMGTHNRLLALGSRVYLEVIARDPDAPPPLRPRWFGLDQVSATSAPRLAAWVASTDDIESTALAAMGTVETMRRAEHTWRMTVTQDGRVPCDGALPALIQRMSSIHPASTLPDAGLQLVRLRIHHPRPAQVVTALDTMGMARDPEIAVLHGSVCWLAADIRTPSGLKALGLALD